MVSITGTASTAGGNTSDAATAAPSSTSWAWRWPACTPARAFLQFNAERRGIDALVHELLKAVQLRLIERHLLIRFVVDDLRALGARWRLERLLLRGCRNDRSSQRRLVGSYALLARRGSIDGCSRCARRRCGGGLRGRA